MDETDARVASGAFYDNASGAQRAALLVPAHHPQGGAVFNGATRIEELGFAEYFAPGELA